MVDPAMLVSAAPVALGIAKKVFKKYTSKTRGSKVKMGEFAQASIKMFGDKACIKLNKEGSQVLLLTSENVESYRYVKEKKKPPSMHTYFYYDIIFKDGSESYVQMRRKYKEAMERYA